MINNRTQLAYKENAQKKKKMKFDNGTLFWDVSFFSGLHAREWEVLAGFMDTIYGASVRGFGDDKMCWKSDREKGFMVKDYYSLLVGSNDYSFPWKSIWKQKIPSRVASFVWTVALGKCFNDWKSAEKEGLDIGLVLQVQL